MHLEKSSLCFPPADALHTLESTIRARIETQDPGRPWLQRVEFWDDDDGGDSGRILSSFFQMSVFFLVATQVLGNDTRRRQS